MFTLTAVFRRFPRQARVLELTRAGFSTTPVYMAEKKPNPSDFLTMGRVATEPNEPEATDEETFARQERLKKKADQKYNERLTRNLRIGLVSVTLLAAGSIALLGMPEEKEEEKDENIAISFFNRAWSRVAKWFEKTSEPIYGPKLLPDPLPPPYNRPATLVVELNEALVHLDWDKSVGWRIAVRPGAKEFLSYLSRYYEIVIFANTPSYQAHAVIDTFDPYNFATYRLYRESTRFQKGNFIKDLSSLNRDLSKVICVDINPEAYSLQPENGLFLQPWNGEKNDTNLKDMMTLLEVRIANSSPENPFQAWQEHKQKLKQEFQAQLETSRPKSGIASLFSKSKSSSPANIFDYIEKIGREERVNHEKYIKQELENMKKMRDEAEAKMIEDVKNQKLKLVDSLFGAPQPKTNEVSHATT